MTTLKRKCFLSLHVTTSIGWIGAVSSFLALAIVGMVSTNRLHQQIAYISMQWITWLVIVPLAFASLASGIVCSQSTRWGLFRYYWVFIKFVLTTLAVVVLLIHTRIIDHLSVAVNKTTMIEHAFHTLQLHIVLASVTALVVLTILAVVSVFKPKGKTRYGMHNQISQLTNNGTRTV